MKFSLKYIFVALLCCANLNFADAQDSTAISRNVDVVNTYQPTLRSASKVRNAPAMDDTMSYKPSFKYQTLNRVTAVTTKPDELSPADMSFPSYESPYRWLIEGAVGNSPNIFGQITYNMRNSEDYHLSLRAGHFAQLGKVKLDNDDKVKAPQNDTWAVADFHRLYDETRLGLNLRFDNSVYKYYGLNTVDDNGSYLLENGNVVTGDDLNADDKQRNTSISLGFNLANAMIDPRKKFTYNAGFNFAFLGNKSGVHQTDLKFYGDLRFPVKYNSHIDANIAVNHFKTHEGDSTAVFTFYEHKTTDINVTPHFLLEYDYMKLQFGLRVIAVIGDDFMDDDFLVQPDIRTNFFIGDGSLRLYLAITGDYKPNSYRSLIAENRYMSPDMHKYIWSRSDSAYVERTDWKFSQAPFVFKFGFRVAFSKMVQLHMGIDYKSLGDEVFFINRSFVSNTNADSVAYNSQFAMLQDDGKLFRAHAELNICPTESSNINLAATYYNYDMDYLDEPWYKPSFDLTLTGRLSPIERLNLSASLGIVGQRYAYNATSQQKEKLSTFVDLNIGGQYYISNRWTCFLSLNNLTASDQQQWLGYSSYRINAMAGITYKF